ncbi:hypothetical protein AA313_de0207675 [Arthrobotrys entomopaga]|nr:hypothetical protein AA313_de0207675 [Arthrobotrys entomopaga]
MTVPIRRDADGSPTIRQAFLYFLTLAAGDQYRFWYHQNTHKLLIRKRVPRKTQSNTETEEGKPTAEPSPDKQEYSQNLSAAKPSRYGKQRAAFPAASSSDSPPISHLPPIMQKAKNTKENISKPDVRSTNPLTWLSTDLQKLRVSETSDIGSPVLPQDLPGSSVVKPQSIAYPKLDTGTFTHLSSESHTPPVPAGTSEEKSSTMENWPEVLNPQSCVIYSHIDSRRDHVHAIFQPISLDGLGARERVWEGKLTWRATSNTYPCYFKVFRDDCDPGWGDELNALYQMKDTDATSQLLIWGYTTGNEEIPSGLIIGTGPVKGEAHEPEWWLDPSNEASKQRLVEVLGKFRRKNMVIYHPRWWDVLVDDDDGMVRIIDLESCVSSATAHRVHYTFEMQDILQDQSMSWERFGGYAGPIASPVALPAEPTE